MRSEIAASIVETAVMIAETTESFVVNCAQLETTLDKFDYNELMIRKLQTIYLIET
jgi:hypothetical protein